MSKTKHEKGMCVYFGCKAKATIRYSTPGFNPKDNYEQIFCDRHWKLVTSIPGSKPIDETRITRI